jgi:peptidoglycan-N-acetylglucosamine deacetylase
MYLVRTPGLLKPLFKDLLWDLRGPDRAVYVTFDDGPIPEVTPWVLDQLAARGAKATFFCIGRNAEANPELLARIRQEGHSVGNHTWDHPDGWKTPGTAYLRNVLRCQQIVRSRLFRPPYGKITREQAAALSRRFKVVMWEVLSADFDLSLDAAECIRNVTLNTQAGSIVVFHDSLKAWDRLRGALPTVLDHLMAEGYDLRAIPEDLA